MTADFKRHVVLSAAVHVGLIVFFVIASFVTHVKRKKEPHEIMTFIDVQASIPSPPALQTVEKVSIPEPPEPPETIPEPVKKKKKIEKSKKKIKRTDLKKKKPDTKLTPEQIKKMLASGIKPSDTARPATSDFAFSWYLALVRQTMHDAWAQPSDLAGQGLIALVSIRVERNGRISDWEMVRGPSRRRPLAPRATIRP